MSSLTKSDREVLTELFHAHHHGKRFTRRTLILIAHEANMPLRDCCIALDRMGLIRDGSWAWFDVNGGITPGQVFQVISEAHSKPRSLELPTPNLTTDEDGEICCPGCGRMVAEGDWAVELADVCGACERGLT